MRSRTEVSERRACAVIGQPRATQRRRPIIRADEDALTAAIIRLATTYGRYGYRRITALLRAEGWRVNLKRVYRIWRREGLKVPQKQPERGRLWLNDGSCIRLRPEHPGHVWAYDFVQDRTQDGRAFRMLTVIDEFTRHCLAIVTARKLKVLIERWRCHYNAVRPHSSLRYRPPAPETVLPPAFELAYATLRPAQMLATERRVLT